MIREAITRVRIRENHFRCLWANRALISSQTVFYNSRQISIVNPVSISSDVRWVCPSRAGYLDCQFQCEQSIACVEEANLERLLFINVKLVYGDLFHPEKDLNLTLTQSPESTQRKAPRKGSHSDFRSRNIE